MIITPDSLMTLEAYSKFRKERKGEIIALRRLRSVALGEHLTVQFESEQTIRYQIQEMLRIEKIFEEQGIQDELDAYNPLIPDGRNLKATMMIEYEDANERKAALARLKGIEDRTWLRVEGCPPVYAIADEDLERENADKTSSVHFLRFELTSEMVDALKYGVGLSIGIDHPHYKVTLDPAPSATREALLRDLD